MEGLNPVLDKLLVGDPALAALRAQAARARMVSREHSGVGFFCTFEVPADARRLEAPGRFTVGDVNAEISGLAHCAGFVLFGEGCLDVLENFSFDEPWPNEIGFFKLSYQVEPRDLAIAAI